MRPELDDLLESLREENEALLTRVAHLEATRDEYRRQMAGLLNSWSWRVTAPLRGVAASGRLVRRRIREMPGRAARRPNAAPFATNGLFPPEAPPPGGLVTAASPLLAHPGPTTDRRPPRLDGSPSDARVLVVAHVYYPEVWFDIEDRLVRIPEPHDLVVSLVDGRAASLEPEIRERLPHAMIHHVENRGRDLGSLVELANAGLFDGYDAILKVHTKRSPHRIDGDAWRVALLDGLMPSPEGIRRILELLRQDRSVGLVVPSESLHGTETWGSNQVLVEALAARIPFAFDPDALRYPAGSMYWARPWVLRRLADLRLGPQHFEPEAGHVDGSTAHALERFVGVAAQVSGLDVVDAVDVASRLGRVRRKSSRRPKVLAFCQPPSDPEVTRRQAVLAAEHGVDDFVLRPPHEAALRNLLDDPTIELSFALCWDHESPADRFYDDVLPALSDPRYVTVDGRPLLVLDRIGHVEDAVAAVARWKERARDDGLGGLHVLAVGLPSGAEGAIDGLIRLQPVPEMQTTGPRGLRVHPGVMPGRDALHGANPLSFRRWVARASDAAGSGAGEPLLFVDAWKILAEGAYLEAVRDALGAETDASLAPSPVAAESVAR